MQNMIDKSPYFMYNKIKSNEWRYLYVKKKSL